MRNIFVVHYRSYKAHPNDPNELVGVYTSKTLALYFARRALKHRDDETVITTQPLNKPSVGEAIWDSSCDQAENVYRLFYADHWPLGIPPLKPALS